MDKALCYIGVPQRLDAAICQIFPQYTRSAWKNKLEKVLVFGSAVKLSRVIRARDLLELSYHQEAEPVLAQPEDIPLTALYEDEDFLVIDKPAGLVVHPGAGNPSHTVVNALAFHLQKQKGAQAQLPGEDQIRPGIVHRLDKETSGVLLTAKTEAGLFRGREIFSQHEAKKVYITLVKGVFKFPNAVIQNNLIRDPKNRLKFCSTSSPYKGKEAISHVTRLAVAAGQKYSLLKVEIETGRTHQIRVHLSEAGCPIVGDPLYARPDERFRAKGMMLCALLLKAPLRPGDKPRAFRAPLPTRMKDALKELLAEKIRS